MSSLFNNPMVDMAMKALTPEQRAEYEKIGKYIFKTDYTKETQKINPQEEIKEAVVYIENCIRSGLHPNDLNDREKQIMIGVKGKHWYKEFDYNDSDMN